MTWIKPPFYTYIVPLFNLSLLPSCILISCFLYIKIDCFVVFTVIENKQKLQPAWRIDWLVANSRLILYRVVKNPNQMVNDMLILCTLYCCSSWLLSVSFDSFDKEILVQKECYEKTHLISVLFHFWRNYSSAHNVYNLE